MNDHFCVMPWVHIHTYPDGQAALCCNWDQQIAVGNVQEDTIDKIVNSAVYKRVRLQMLNNQPVDGCHRCKKAENPTDNPRTSYRQRTNQFFEKIDPTIVQTLKDSTYPDGGLKIPFHQRTMNIRYSNLCNYACRSCGPVHSSMWAQENGESKFVHKIVEILPDFTEQIWKDLPYVEYISFAGGESLLIDEHWQVMDRLIELDRTHVHLNYVTNLSKLEHQKKSILEYAQKFPNLKLMVSIDATHQRAEIYRHGTNWTTVEYNLSQLREHNVQFYINCTVGAMNVWHAPDAHRYLLENNLIPADSFAVNILVYNDFLSTKILPTQFKKQVTDKILNHINWLTQVNQSTLNAGWQDLINFMNSEDHSYLLGQFISYNLNLDRIRDENSFEVFPELSVLINNQT